MLADLLIIAVGLAALVWSADLFIDGAAAIARKAGMAPLLIGMTIVSIGTSAPEILVSLMSALAGSGSLAVGNAFGSNIANIGLVLGITLVISPITVGRTTALLDLPLLLTTIALCGFLLFDGVLSFWDSIALLVGLGLFLTRMYTHVHQPDINDEAPVIPEMSAGKAWLMFAIGLLILIGSSRALVYSAVNIATSLGVSELIIGLTIVAIGTSLPELAASTISAMRGHADIAIGAIVGSNMFNLLVVLSLPGLFDDVVVGSAEVYRDLGTVFATTALLALFIWFKWNKTSGRARLGRLPGFTFLGIYVVYYFWLFYATTQA